MLDASAALEFLLATPAGRAVAARIAPSGESLHVPHLIDLEVAQVLRRREASQMITPVRARQALADFSDLDLFRYPHDALLPRIWALRKNVTAYDAAYLALAEALDAPLLTTDGKLARSRGHRARVQVVPTG